jgi:hypothetical protein
MTVPLEAIEQVQFGDSQTASASLFICICVHVLINNLCTPGQMVHVPYHRCNMIKFTSTNFTIQPILLSMLIF